MIRKIKIWELAAQGQGAVWGDFVQRLADLGTVTPLTEAEHQTQVERRRRVANPDSGVTCCWVQVSADDRLREMRGAQERPCRGGSIVLAHHLHAPFSCFGGASIHRP